MKTIELVFKKDTPNGTDDFNNPIVEKTDIAVPGCLIAPITEPANAREQQALENSRDQVRIHLPKTYTGDVGNSEVEWGGKTFRLDSDSVPFMNENCPTKWNRYFRAEAING